MNTEIEKNKKVLDELLVYLINTAQLAHQRSSLKEIRRSLNQPTQPEGYQGLNKWYLTDLGSVYFINSEIKVLGGYGLDSKGKWWNTEYLVNKSNIKRLATESEIIEAIKKGLEQKGIVEGARVKSLKSKEIWKLNRFDDFIYYSDLNCVYVDCVKVFDNGTFAEVVKEEKPTDKELLKECAELLEILFSRYYSGAANQKVEELLTKLNKHLNHE